MGVSVRKKDGSWYVFVNHNGHRKAKKIGDSRVAAVQVKKALEAKLSLGDIGFRTRGAPGAHIRGIRRTVVEGLCTFGM